MAEVYRAYHASLDRYVAIKVLHAFLADDPEFKTRFEREARNVARLKHPNIVQVYDFDFDPPSESFYMVMELVEGPTLKDRLQAIADQGGLLPLEESLRIIREAAGALAYAHSRDMIHRDVKPANLMLDHDNRVVLTDFGIAKIVTGAQFTASGGMVGTPAYMAPEQGLGEPGDERSDLYSLGIILFQLVTGRLPYDAETPLAIVLKHLQTPTPSARVTNPDVPVAVDQVVNKAIAKDAGNRYQSAAEFIRDLERVERGELVAAGNGSKPVLLQSPDQDTVKVLHADDTPTQHLTQPLPAIAPPVKRRRSGWLWGGLLAGAAALLVMIGASRGMFAGLVGEIPTLTPTSLNVAMASAEVTETAGSVLVPTSTTTRTLPTTPTSRSIVNPTERPSLTPTFTATRTPTVRPSLTLTLTSTATATRTPTLTWTPSPTRTPTNTATATPNMTASAAVIAAVQTATATACTFDYEIVEQDPPNNDIFPANTPYERRIVFKNTGTCAWEPNTFLIYVEGESFSAGPIVLISKRTEVNQETELLFSGKTPLRGDIYEGVWELRTPNQRKIGQPIEIGLQVYEGGH